VSAPYYVCRSCAHFWAEPEPPARCESCGRANLTTGVCYDAALAASDAILRRTKLAAVYAENATRVAAAHDDVGGR
jgi:hypothetical protein